MSTKDFAFGLILTVLIGLAIAGATVLDKFEERINHLESIYGDEQTFQVLQIQMVNTQDAIQDLQFDLRDIKHDNPRAEIIQLQNLVGDHQKRIYSREEDFHKLFERTGILTEKVEKLQGERR